MRQLRDVLDQENYRRLVLEFGGKRVWIPKRGNLGYRDKNYIISRNSEIIHFFRNGKSIKELALRFCISTKRVYGIVEEMNKESNSRNPGRRDSHLRIAI